MTVLVLDAAALLNSEGFLFNDSDRYFCPVRVLEEWRDFRSRMLAENALQSGVLTVIDPCPLSVEAVHGFLAQNRLKGLSDADVSVIALALELQKKNPGLMVVTDDFSVQNVLKLKGIGFVGVAQGTITKSRRYLAGK